MALDAAVMRIMARLDALERQTERTAAADFAIATSQILTSMLAANAVTQTGISFGTGGTSTSTAFFTVPGTGTSSELRVDMTTVGGPLLTLLMPQSQNGQAAQSNFYAVSLDGAAEPVQRYVTAAFAGFGAHCPLAHLFTGVAAGAHTVRGRAKTTGNTMTMEGSCLIVVELKR